MKKALVATAWIVVACCAVVILFLTWATINDYTPPEKQVIIKTIDKTQLTKDTLTALIWNIGYAGLGPDMDFFYDGGTKTRTSKETTQQNLKEILNFLENQPGVDFFLLQEVDYKSKRSYYINETDIIENNLNEYHWNFALNYNVKFVPSPVSDPLGHIESGLMTGSRFQPVKVERHNFKANYSWPKSVFMLDRCFMVHSFLTKNGDSLFIVNTHNTAYDDGGIRKKQMRQLKKWITEKHDKQNHILVGGDWNQLPPGIVEDYFGFQPKSTNFHPSNIINDFLLPGWQFHFDNKQPTNRGLDTVYNTTSYTTILDYYLASPSIKVLDIQSINLDFQFSDHNPVLIKFHIKNKLHAKNPREE